MYSFFILERWNVSEEVLAKPWLELSAAEYQIIVLAMAVACRPDILLLDEPTRCVRVVLWSGVLLCWRWLWHADLIYYYLMNLRGV